MEHISPSDRHQVTFESPDELIIPDDPVRFPDAYAEKMDLIKNGTPLNSVQFEGRLSILLRSSR